MKEEIAMNNYPPEYQSNPYEARPNEARSWQQPPYANPNDQPLMVPKRFGWGYSPNWNNPKAVMLFLGFILVIVILVAIVLPVLLHFLVR
jgi:uncharacterized membrane protein